MVEKANYPIALMCRVLGVSRSGWYAWKARVHPTSRESSDAELLDKIRKIHESSHCIYGSPRVHAQLVRDGEEVGKDRVARLMRAAGLRGRVHRKFKVTTDSKHDKAIAPNTLNQQFEAESTDSIWCADITSIRTLSGWVYLATILDLHSRLIVGWSMATHMRTELVEGALLNALSHRAPASRLLHHSDRGSQYASDQYRKLLELHGIECSMSRTGNCFDNAVQESFFGSFKQEWANQFFWRGLREARASTHYYIEAFYNRKRLHSALGYRTPAEVDEAAA